MINFLVFLDYYEALRWARKLTDELEHTINKDLTPEEQVTVSNILTLNSWILFFENIF